ncbi:enkurin domain-containing protein [Anaeramoeba ignava]|uniref:Enkurin domain-containing protein n=1 Tax=Anaeramoeba ignava TaxID=1746090 RepID=A0A9Q0LNT5_ANAIG|nr:enkurin domain-containing protein [Anaeramoeba ignava]
MEKKEEQKKKNLKNNSQNYLKNNIINARKSKSKYHKLPVIIETDILKKKKKNLENEIDEVSNYIEVFSRNEEICIENDSQ